MTPDTADAWSRLHHDLLSPVTAIVGYTQLLQRQVLRADGLTPSEHDQMLGTLANTLTAIQHLTEQLKRLLPEEPRPPSN